MHPLHGVLILQEYWSIGVFGSPGPHGVWSIGLGWLHGSIGVWSIGVLEYWSIGVWSMEYGVLKNFVACGAQMCGALRRGLLFAWGRRAKRSDFFVQ